MRADVDCPEKERTILELTNELLVVITQLEGDYSAHFCREPECTDSKGCQTGCGSVLDEIASNIRGANLRIGGLGIKLANAYGKIG